MTFRCLLAAALLIAGRVAAAPVPAELGVLELADGDTYLARVTLAHGSAEAVQTENEEAAWWWDFSAAGNIFYAEGIRLRRDSEGEHTPVLVANLDRTSRTPAALGAEGRVAFTSVNDVNLARWDDVSKKLFDIRPVLLPPHCRGRDLAFSKNGRALYVLCRTPAPVSTWFVTADTTTGRGEHFFARDADRLLGVLKDGGPMVLVTRAGTTESAISLGTNGKVSVLFKAKEGETLVGLLGVRGELVIAGAPATKGKLRSLRAAKLGTRSSRMLVKPLAFSDVTVSRSTGVLALTLPSPGEDEAGDIALLKPGEPAVRRVLRAEPSKQHLYSRPLQREP